MGSPEFVEVAWLCFVLVISCLFGQSKVRSHKLPKLSYPESFKHISVFLAKFKDVLLLGDHGHATL